MEATLKLKNGIEGTVKSIPGQKLKYSIVCPDTDLNRACVMDSLFSLVGMTESIREKMGARMLTERSSDFPIVRMEPYEPEQFRRHNADPSQAPKYRAFSIVEDSFAAFPYFYTFGATREDFAATERAVLALNSFAGVPWYALGDTGHYENVLDAYGILGRAVEDLLAGKITVEDLGYAYAEAKEVLPPPPHGTGGTAGGYYFPKPPELNLPPGQPPRLRLTEEPPPPAD